MAEKTLIYEIADSAGNNETAKNADIAEILKTKEYLNEKNAVDEECDRKLSMPVKKTSALLECATPPCASPMTATPA